MTGNNTDDANEYIEYLLGVIDGINYAAKQGSDKVAPETSMMIIEILSNFKYIKKYSCEINLS
jgi:hypothetical protein